MADKKEKVEYTKSTAELDLEERLADDYLPPAARETLTLNPNQQKNEDEDEAFQGVSPDYQNYANESDKPYSADGGVQQKVEELVIPEYVEPDEELSLEERKARAAANVRAGSQYNPNTGVKEESKPAAKKVASPSQPSGNQ